MADFPIDDSKGPVSHNVNTNNQEGWQVKEAKILPETVAQGRVDLDPHKFQVLLQQKGIRIKIYRTMYCPNVKSADGAEHEIDCPLCGGSNYVDTDCIDTIAFIQNQDLKRNMTEGGDFDGNTVMMSFPIGIELQYFTKIELTDFTGIYYQRVLRKPGSNTDVLKYKACRVNVLMDKNGQKYYQQQDFDLDQNGNIIWLTKTGARKPSDNLVYSIHYETHVQYRAVKAIHVSRFTQYKSDQGVEHIKMPEQWMCTKEFLLRRKDINTQQYLEQGPYDDHQNTTGENG